MRRSPKRTVRPALADWVAIGGLAVRARPLLRACVSTALLLARTVLHRRLRAQRWIYYEVDLTGTLPGISPDVRLTRVTEDVIAKLREHRESAENALKTGLRFWDHGLRRAYVWMEGPEPLCIQWLLTRGDQARLRTLGDSAGRYPPLPGDVGRVESLFAFETARRQGIASRFEYALYHEARRLGLARLVSHVHEANTAARGWADRAGWRRCGTITRYQLDLPWFRARSLYVHRHETTGPGPAMVQPSARVHARTA